MWILRGLSYGCGETMLTSNGVERPVSAVVYLIGETWETRGMSAAQLTMCLEIQRTPIVHLRIMLGEE